MRESGHGILTVLYQQWPEGTKENHER